jgi:transmembrane sensor
MNTSDEEIRDAIAEQAAEWLVANLSGSLDDLGRQNFLAWLRSSPIHVSEYLSIGGIDSDLTAATATLDESIDALVASAREERSATVPSAPAIMVARGRERLRSLIGSSLVFRTVVAALFLVAVGMAAWKWGDALATRSQQYSTAHGAEQLLHLSDGSEVHLDTDSALTVRFSGRERLVELERGQAYFRVSHDPRRFRVTVAGASVVAVGTEFDVDQRGQSAFVTLIEGRLAVVSAGVAIPKPGVPLSGAAILNQGEQARLVSGGSVSIGPASLPSVMAWLEHQMVVDNRPLGEVAAEFNRYGKTPIEIGDADVGRLRISGTFNVGDSESFLAFLEQMEGLTVARSRDAIRVTRRRPVGR